MNKLTQALILVMAVFTVSLGYTFFADIQPYGDAQAYDRIGWNLARGLGYIEHEENASNIRADDAIFRIGPAYEFFLAGIYKLFGHRNEPVWIAHTLLRALTAFLLFHIALLLFAAHPRKEWIGLAAAALFGFFPDLMLMNGFLLYETLLLFFGVGAVYFSLKALINRTDRTNRTYPILAASLFWSLAILTRPSELLPFLVFPAAMIFRDFDISIHKTIARNWRVALLSFMFPILLVGGWSLRNSLLYDQPLFTTTAGAYALWVGNNPKASGGYDRPPMLQEARNRYHSTELSLVSTKNVAAFIRHRPLKFLELQFKKAVIYFSILRPTGFWPHLQYTPIQRLLIVGASAIATAFLFILGAAGAWLLWKSRDRLSLTLLAFAATKPLAVIPFYVETRYRYSLYPLLAIMAAFFLIHYVTSPRRARFIKIAAGALALFLVIASIDAWFSLEIIINRLSLLLKTL